MSALTQSVGVIGWGIEHLPRCALQLFGPRLPDSAEKAPAALAARSILVQSSGEYRLGRAMGSILSRNEPSRRNMTT